MRRLFLLVFATGLIAAAPVALGSASRAAPHKASIESANAYLDAGVAPATNSWTWPGGDEMSTRFSQLKQITSSNVSKLKVAWNASLQPAPGPPAGIGGLQQQPICCPDNLMFVPIFYGGVAVNPVNGQKVWEYQDSSIRASSGHYTPSRGEGYDAKDDLVFIGQLDGSIVALHMKTGVPAWTTQISSAGTYGSVTRTESAPYTQYYDDGGDGIVLSAPNGGDSPLRGHIDALDAKTGALIWRTWLTPDPTQLPYILSWSNPVEAATAGAADWSIPAIDPKNGLVIFGTGNAYPYVGRQPGDDLWTASIMAVDWKTGALRWYYQEVRHDIWDYDSPEPPTIMNVPIDGKMTTVVAEAGKDGLLYVLNARNGGYLPHFKFATIPTADPSGRGIKLNSLPTSQRVPLGAAGCLAPSDYTAAGLAACSWPSDYLQISFGGAAPHPGQAGSYGPNVTGANGTSPCPTCAVVNIANNRPVVGTSMFAASTSDAYLAWGAGSDNFPFKAYSPLTHDLYFCTAAGGSAHSNAGSFSQGTESYGLISLGAATADPRLITATVSAIDMTNNTMAWQFRSYANTYGSCNAGTLTTDGNLVFTSLSGRTDQTPTALFAAGTPPQGAMLAMDATTGKILYEFDVLGGTITAPPITYTFNGKQYIAIYHTLPTPGTLPGNAGSLPSGQTDQLTVLSL